MKFLFLSKSGQPPQKHMKCLNKTTYCTHIFKRFRRFREEHDDLEDHLMSGWPLAAQNQSIAGVREIVTRDHQMVIKLMEGQLHINWEKICYILPEEWETVKSAWNLFNTISWMNSFYHDGEALSVELQHGGDQPQTFFTWPQVSQLLSTPSSENCPQSYKISRCHTHQVEHNHRVTCSSFGSIWLLLFKTFITK